MSEALQPKIARSSPDSRQFTEKLASPVPFGAVFVPTSCSTTESLKEKPRHRKQIMATQMHSERLSLNMHKELLKHVDTELRSLNLILKEVQTKKTSLQSYLCKFLSPFWEESLHKPRNLITLKANEKVADTVLKALVNPLQAIPSNIFPGSTNICSRTAPIVFDPNLTLQERKQNFYDIELKKLIETTKPEQEMAGQEKSQILKTLAHNDFTCYGKTMCGLVLYMKYVYDFIPANPLLLLSARWGFIPQIERIVRFVLRKRKMWQKESEFRYSDYKDKYVKWKSRRFEVTNHDGPEGQRLQRRVDIYGREAPSITASPIIPMRVGLVPSLGDCLGSPLLQLQMRKESLDLDPDLCTYCVLKST